VIPSAHVRKKLRLQFVVDRLICASSKARTPEAGRTFALTDALLRQTALRALQRKSVGLYS
jgi:hypothetical protein